MQLKDSSRLVTKIQAVLSEDLLLPKYRGSSKPFFGHCYAASEALYHLLGGRDAGLKPMNMKVGNVSHWFLLKEDEIIDPTAAQFDMLPNYKLARGKGFLTKNPSKRARLIMDRIAALDS
jgi:hypothetical protein